MNFLPPTQQIAITTPASSQNLLQFFFTPIPAHRNEYHAPNTFLQHATMPRKKIKARLHIAPSMPKPKCVSGTICMKWNFASGKRLPPLSSRNFSSLTYKVFLHTNRRSMISGILSARHTGSLAFRLQKIFLFSYRTRALPQVLRHNKFFKVIE